MIPLLSLTGEHLIAATRASSARSQLNIWSKKARDMAAKLGLGTPQNKSTHPRGYSFHREWVVSIKPIDILIGLELELQASLEAVISGVLAECTLIGSNEGQIRAAGQRDASLNSRRIAIDWCARDRKDGAARSKPHL